MGDLEKQMVSITRLFKLLEIPQEKVGSNLKLPISEDKLKTEWPQQGNVSFTDVHLRYRPQTELVLKGLDFDI